MIKLLKPITTSILCKIFKLKYYGKDMPIVSFGNLLNDKKNMLSFSNDISEVKNKIIIQKSKKKSKYSTIILSRNPRLLFCEIINYFIINKQIIIQYRKNRIHPSVKIQDLSILGNNIIIEKNCIIEPGAKIFSNVVIKKNSIIRSGAIISGHGFGYERDRLMKPIKFPQFGSVLIKENAHIGNNTCIVKSTFDKTIIGKNTKIDNLVHIAHNVKIGNNCIITAKCQIAGSVLIGNNVWLSPSSTIKNKVSLKDNVFVGIGSVVIFDIKKNERVFGNPAQSLK